MAHFLSEVTHLKLDQRDEETGELSQYHTESANGMIRTHQFQSLMRCVTVVDTATAEATQTQPTDSRPGTARGVAKKVGGEEANTGAATTTHAPPANNAKDLSKMITWSGDIDGPVVVRKGITGKPIATIDKKHNIFAYSIHYEAPYVWVGYSDGYVNIYHATNFSKVFELRAHTAAVNCIISANNSVYTGGCDWQIVQWDPVSFSRVAHGQLSGHQNSVRAMCLGDDPTTLFSAGDDYSIRCWDLTTSREKASPWPIVGHRNSVKTIVVNDVYLFSGSSDGSVKVWNTQTAQLTRQLEDRGEGIAINSLMLDRANDCVWAGGTDGMIRLWDSTTLTELTHIHDHRHTHVAHVMSLARISAFKSWAVTASGDIKIVFSDEAGASHVPGEVESRDLNSPELSPSEQRFQLSIDTKRDQIVQNYKELQNCKDELKKLEKDELAAKTRIAGALGSMRQDTMKATGLYQSRKWLDQQQRLHVMEDVAQRMHLSQEEQIRSRYFFSWLRVTTVRREKTQKAKSSTALVQIHQARVKQLYAYNLLEHARRTKNVEYAGKMVRWMRQISEQVVRRAFFAKWSEYRQMRKFKAKRSQLAASLARFSDRATRDAAWHRARTSMQWSRCREQMHSVFLTMSSTNEERVRGDYFGKWIRFCQKRIQDRTKDRVITIMCVHSSHCLLHRYYHKWANMAKEIRSRELQEKAEQQREVLCELQAEIDRHSSVTEEQLEQDLLAKQQELAELSARLREADHEVGEAKQRKRLLQRELMKDISIGSDQPQLVQLKQAMYLIKARGVNVFYSHSDIEKSREEVKSFPAPEMAFEQGLGIVRSVCQLVIKPERLTERGVPDWFVGSLFDRINKKNLLKASVGITRMVTAFDMLSLGAVNAWIYQDANGRDFWSPKHKYMEETLANFGTLLELSVRIYRLHRGEDPKTGEPLSKKKFSPKRRRASPSAASRPPPAKKAKKKKVAKKKTEGDGATKKPKTKKATKKPVDGDADAGEKPKGKKSTKKRGAAPGGKAGKKRSKRAKAPPPATQNDDESPLTTAAASPEASPEPTRTEEAQATSTEQPPNQHQQEQQADDSAKPNESTTATGGGGDDTSPPPSAATGGGEGEAETSKQNAKDDSEGTA